MVFRRIVAIVASVVIFVFICAVVGTNFGSNIEGAWLMVLLTILSTTLFYHGVSGGKSRSQNEVTKEDMTRIETSIGELRNQVDEIHEYMADMYIRHDEEQPRPK